MRIKDKESDLATNLMLGLLVIALVGIAGNGIMYSSKHHSILVPTIAASR